ncbi:hypothetical protein JKP88DRAFT_339811 [Tribonema minus]|uniref:Ap4A phosphorylase 1/2 N-terminal domain-containing protein n=1 Tax=Tribonema minus TaxID=303371 RepID=A0A835YG93_9STRA|nr:hypothetical protein JKP88DRAFT_339811 [Tribonema minus]
MCIDTTQKFPLRERARQTSKAALAGGSLRPLATSHTVVQDGGIPFTVFSLDEKALAAKKRGGASVCGRKQRFSGLPPNPFAGENRDPALVVGDVGNRHTCILNKFNVLDDHALIITNSFEPQSAPLTADDLAAFFAGVTALPGVGFFNSGPQSGASQRHRHMQLVPYDTLRALHADATTPALPLNTLVRAAAAAARRAPRPGATFTLPQLKLRHAVRLLDPAVAGDCGGSGGGGGGAAAVGAYLKRQYDELLRDVGYAFPVLRANSFTGQAPFDDIAGAAAAEAQQCGGARRGGGAAAGYNLVLTRDYMFVVARARAPRTPPPASTSTRWASWGAC